jgi:hypothetical protein
VIAGHAPGHVDWQTTAQLAIARDKARIEVPALAAVAPEVIAPPGPEVIAPPPIASAPSLVEPAQPPVGWRTRRRTIALGVAGAGVASVVVGAIVGASARGKKNDALALCPTAACGAADQANALMDSAHHRALAANLAFGVAGASAVAAGLLWFTGAPTAESPRRVSVAPSVQPGAAQLVVTGRF